MSTTTRRDKTAAEQLATEHTHIPRRTVRAIRESMAVDAYAHGTGTGLFDVYSGSGRRYTVDLRRAARGETACDCPDAHQNLDDADVCKHTRRVKLMLGITAVPPELGKHIDGTLRLNMTKFGATPPASVSVRPQVAADGGSDTDGRGGQDENGS